MSTKRIDKVNSLLQQEIGKIIQREAGLPADVLVTLVRVDTSPNLIQTKAHISVLPESRMGEIIKMLNSQIYEIQQKINRLVNMRPVPKIIFVKDEEEAKAGKVEEILSELKKEEN